MTYKLEKHNHINLAQLTATDKTKLPTYNKINAAANTSSVNIALLMETNLTKSYQFKNKQKKAVIYIYIYFIYYLFLSTKNV